MFQKPLCFGCHAPLCDVCQVFETRTQKNTAEPVWEETHNFDTVGEKEFKIEVYDKDKVGKDDLLGEIQVPFKELGLQHGASSRWIPVFKYVWRSGHGVAWRSVM